MLRKETLSPAERKAGIDGDSPISADKGKVGTGFSPYTNPAKSLGL
jgi:hypothetical protein